MLVPLGGIDEGGRLSAHESSRHELAQDPQHAMHAQPQHADHGNSEHRHSEHRHSEHRHSEHRHDAHDTGHDHGDAGEHAHHAMDASWRGAAQATLHCLTGCAIGEVLGMVIGTSIGLHNAGTVVLSIVLAFAFGYSLTMRGVLRAGVPFRQALTVALAADTVSIAVMELADNGVVLAIPGAMDAGITSLLFWVSLALSLAVAFVVTTPVNRWMIARGRGHAVVHAYHH
jgi:hypothetical protein